MPGDRRADQHILIEPVIERGEMRVGGQVQQLEIGDDPRNLFETVEEARLLVPDDIPDRLALAHIGHEKRKPEEHQQRRGKINPQAAARHDVTESQDAENPMNAVGEKPAGDERCQRQQRQQPESEKPAARVGGRAGLDNNSIQNPRISRFGNEDRIAVAEASRPNTEDSSR